MKDPDWLEWARELQAIAQTGLMFCRDPYDRERYGRRSTMITSQLPVDRWHEIIGEPTPSWIVSSTTLIASNSPARACVGPKQSIRGRLDPTSRPVTTIHRPARLATRAASFRSGGRHHSGIPGGIIPLYPGGFVEIGNPARRLGRREPDRGAKRRTKQGHAPRVFSCCKFFFVCALIGGRAATSHETSEVEWFHEANIPADLSLERVLPQQIRRMFAHRRDPSLPTDFD